MGIKGFETQQRARKVVWGGGGGGLGMNHNIWVIWVCATAKGMVFKQRSLV